MLTFSSLLAVYSFKLGKLQKMKSLLLTPYSLTDFRAY